MRDEASFSATDYLEHIHLNYDVASERQRRSQGFVMKTADYSVVKRQPPSERTE